MLSRLLRASVALLGVLTCGRQIELGRDRPGTAGQTAVSDASIPCQITTCEGEAPRECGNCLDDDNDGLVDSADPECLDPCDGLEDSFAIGQFRPSTAQCKQDCYFDQNSGGGNDDCHWSHSCDPLSMPPDYPPEGDSHCAYDETTKVPGTSLPCAELAITQSAACLEHCLPITPRGCDCFGCCELPAGSGHHVWIGASPALAGSCDDQHLGDSKRCPPCTQVKGCLNNCPVGSTVCGLSAESVCLESQSCINGCCLPARN